MEPHAMESTPPMESILTNGTFSHGLGPTLVSSNPSNDQILWQGNLATEEQCDLAFEAAHRAFQEWASKSITDRTQIVRNYGRILEEESEPLTALISQETGKSLRDAAGEVKASIAKVELSIEAMSQRRSFVSNVEASSRSETTFRPLGVCFVLGPFNFPLHLPGGQIIPSLLAGNTIVFKPSELTPATGMWMARAWHRAGLPPGVLNVIQGDRKLAQHAIDNQEINAVFFTGSYRAGASIHRQLAGRPEVLVALEMGGNNPIVVAENTPPEKSAGVICASAYSSSGQRCTCARRLIVLDSPGGRAVVETLLKRITKLRVGLAHEIPSPFITPLIHKEAASDMLQAQEKLVSLGGRILLPMQRDARCAALLSPGIIDVTVCEGLPDEEYFGPLLQLSWARDLDHAIDLASQTKYGLAASLLGGTLDTYNQFRQRVAAGIVHWNRQTTGASGRMPFGGIGHSGNHRPAGFWMIDACSDPVASLVSEEIQDDGFDRDQL